MGIAYGVGNELKNKNYTYTNSFYKIHLGYVFKTATHFRYEMVVQPEVNFGKHQLLNRYFVQPHEPDYEALRERFTKRKTVQDYILNIGIVVRTPIAKSFDIYLLGSIGPMITDTETERLSKGFAFSDVIALGISLKAATLTFDFRPSLRHVSNAGFQGSNAGFNTMNVEFQMTVVL
ncbi:acyloxyacyl hydrolase [Flavobacterium saliperosum]|uniref:acyloxyacyl hydrolase n=1 Tax=Flavobacterium saliperosum TaxID=329186 RepID=UPI0039EF1B96